MPAVMTETEARSEIQALTVVDDCLTLTESQLNRCVRVAKRIDRYGRTPTETDWEATWDIAAGVAQGWQILAGNASGQFDFAPESGESYKRSQIAAHCRAQAEYWQTQMEPVVGRALVNEDLTDGSDYDPNFNYDYVRRT